MSDRQPLRTDRANIYIPAVIAVAAAIIVFTFLTVGLAQVPAEDLEKAESETVTVAEPAFDPTDIHTVVSFFVAAAIVVAYQLGWHHGSKNGTDQ